MTAFCSSGYWRTFNDVLARRPSSRMNRLTTSASTGFLMKMSVNFIVRPLRGGATCCRHSAPCGRDGDKGAQRLIGVGAFSDVGSTELLMITVASLRSL